MDTFETAKHQDRKKGAVDITNLMARFLDFAHCNRAQHITAGEAVAAY